VTDLVSEEKEYLILLTCDDQEFAALRPGKIVPALAEAACISAPRAALTGARCSQPGPR